MNTLNPDERPFISGFVDNKGKTWLIDGEASIREIEENTNVQYQKIDNEKDTAELKEIVKQLESLEKEFDNKETLIRIANVLAAFVLRYVRHNTEDIIAMGNIQKSSTYVSLGELFVEIASIYILYVDKFSHNFFSKENNNFFYDRFLDDFIALAMLTNYGINAHAMQGIFVEELNSRIKEYAKFDIIGSDVNQEESQIYQLGINVTKILKNHKQKHLLTGATIDILIQIYVIKEFTALDQIFKRIFTH